jgi:ABC-type uncharacterized transport system auxiliary subunit
MRIAALALALGAAGCISVGSGGDPPDRRAYDLQPSLPSPFPPDADGPEVLRLDPFTADAALDREGLVWRRDGIESGSYPNHRWARPPAEAVRAVLADALARRGVCSVVATDPPVEKADYVLHGHLVRCEEADAGDLWSAVLEVRVAVVRSRDGEEILRRTYARSEKTPERNPGGVVKALRRALDAAAEELATDLEEALEMERVAVSVK